MKSPQSINKYDILLYQTHSISLFVIIIIIIIIIIVVIIIIIKRFVTAKSHWKSHSI